MSKFYNVSNIPATYFIKKSFYQAKGYYDGFFKKCTFMVYIYAL